MLRTYRTLLKLANQNYTAINKNALWTGEIKKTFRSNKNITDPAQLVKLSRDAQNMITYLDGVKMHKQYSDAYFSVSKLSGIEKLKRTAGVVGFELPKAYDASNPQPL